ncbi:hypothetical protein Y032_0130g1570 [Ancylostoma ceylanicum]|uniref:Uncharacterized protein n=1 Tax=Ancylostoma ceylanicum TaxID=53326 RepID=A0A016T7P5_9BILA|nr:hypothetical protein Y032_0130g1570 [Ancylostoma ceylanicum]
MTHVHIQWEGSCSFFVCLASDRGEHFGLLLPRRAFEATQFVPADHVVLDVDLYTSNGRCGLATGLVSSYDPPITELGRTSLLGYDATHTVGMQLLRQWNGLTAVPKFG